MRINKTRSALYRLARLLGDANAVKRGKASKRLLRRIAEDVQVRRWCMYEAKVLLLE